MALVRASFAFIFRAANDLRSEALLAIIHAFSAFLVISSPSGFFIDEERPLFFFSFTQSRQSAAPPVFMSRFGAFFFNNFLSTLSFFVH